MRSGQRLIVVTGESFRNEGGSGAVTVRLLGSSAPLSIPSETHYHPGARLRNAIWLLVLLGCCGGDACSLMPRSGSCQCFFFEWVGQWAVNESGRGGGMSTCPTVSTLACRGAAYHSHCPHSLS